MYGEHKITRKDEEGHCDACNRPLRVGHTVFTAEDGEAWYCSRTCRSKWAAFEADKVAEREFAWMAR